MAKGYGMWHGGSSYSPGTFDDVELFNSQADAINALQERYNSNGHYLCSFFYVTRDHERTYVPCVDTNSYIDLYYGDPNEGAEMYKRISFGPRGGIKIEVC